LARRAMKPAGENVDDTRYNIVFSSQRNGIISPRLRWFAWTFALCMHPFHMFLIGQSAPTPSPTLASNSESIRHATSPTTQRNQILHIQSIRPDYSFRVHPSALLDRVRSSSRCSSRRSRSTSTKSPAPASSLPACHISAAMSFPKQIPRAVKELRLHLCQTGQTSQGVRWVREH
jgi:hypothetical protein